MTTIALLTLCGMAAMCLNFNANVNAQTTGFIQRTFILPNGTIYSLSYNLAYGSTVAYVKKAVNANLNNLFGTLVMYWSYASNGTEIAAGIPINNTADPITIEYPFSFGYKTPGIIYRVGVTPKTTVPELRAKIKTAVKDAALNPTNVTVYSQSPPPKVISIAGSSGTLETVGINAAGPFPSGSVQVS